MEWPLLVEAAETTLKAKRKVTRVEELVYLVCVDHLGLRLKVTLDNNIVYWRLFQNYHDECIWEDFWLQYNLVKSRPYHLQLL